MISLDKIISDFIKAEPISLKDRFIPNIKRLQAKSDKFRRLQDLVKLAGWQTDIREELEKSVKLNIGKLFRPSSLEMSEVKIKAILSEIQANLKFIANIMYHMDEGQKATDKLEEIEKSGKTFVKNSVRNFRR